MPVQDCLLVNNMQEGCFRLTVQRLADTHDITINIVFPSNPQTGDIHLVDYDGDNWWVAYRYGAGTWNIQAEIRGETEGVNNLPKLIWVNQGSSSSLSAIHNINTPFTTLVDAIAEVPDIPSTQDPILEDITGSTGYFNYSNIPDAYKVILIGDKHYLSVDDITEIGQTKSFVLEVNSYLNLEDGANLGDIFPEFLVINGNGAIYQKSIISTPANMITPLPTTTIIDVDLPSIFFEEANENIISENGNIFDLTEADCITNIKLGKVFLSSAGIAKLPNVGNNATSIVVDQVLSGVSTNTLFTLPVGTDSSGELERKITNIHIGSVSSFSGSSFTILKSLVGANYQNQLLQINVDSLTTSNAGAPANTPFVYFQDEDLDNSIINVNINSTRGRCNVLYISSPSFNGNLNLNINQSIIASGVSTYQAVSLSSTDLSAGRLSLSGDYKGHIIISGTTIIDNMFMSGNWYSASNGIFYFSSSTAVANHKIYLNNCKLIVSNTATSLVNNVGGVPAGTLTLVCSNVHTNAMGALPGWVTIEGDLTQNVNYL